MRIIILCVAILAAAAAGFLAMNMVGSGNAPAPVADLIPTPEVELADVLVASETLSTGSRVNGRLRWQPWPQNAVSPEFITKSSRPEALEELSNSVVRNTILVDEPIRPIRLLGGDQSFMSSILPQGKRAVATEIDVDTSAGGFILPDDHVDVIMTTRDRNDNFRTETILNNIRVLAIDQIIQDREGSSDENGEIEGAAVVGQTATLELTPRQAEIITVAQQMADRLTLSLRSIKDVNPADSEKSADHLLGGERSGDITVIKRGQKTTEVQ